MPYDDPRLHHRRLTSPIDGRHDVIDDVLVKVTSGRHRHAAGQIVESARADLDAEPRREPRRHVNAHFEETRDAGQICPAGLA